MPSSKVYQGEGTKFSQHLSFCFRPMIRSRNGPIRKSEGSSYWVRTCRLKAYRKVHVG